MHLKNFSLLENSDSIQKYQLSPAYDLLPVNSIMPEDVEEFALTMNGKKINIKRKDFLIFASNCGIPEKVAVNLIKKVISLEKEYCSMCDISLVSPQLKESIKKVIVERINKLK